jgi:hypothetical protein
MGTTLTERTVTLLSREKLDGRHAWAISVVEAVRQHLRVALRLWTEAPEPGGGGSRRESRTI